MAERIQKITRLHYSEEEIAEKDYQELRKSVSDNKIAILKGIEFLKTLESQGMLDMMNASLKQKEDIIRNVVTDANKEQYTGSMEKDGSLLFLIDKLDVGEIESFTSKLNNGLKNANQTDPDETTSIMGLMRALKDPEINRGIVTMMNFLKGLGKEE